ncbi:MAG TPA: IS1634 family transposase [Bacteroidales bacterium]|nr:IS1634 family transposase [Bacteroidales bacterium]
MYYVCVMFIRKKKNRSGTTSVVDKSGGKFTELITIGVSNSETDIEKLCFEGQQWIEAHTGARNMFQEHEKEQEEKQFVEFLLSNVKNILLNGTQLLLNNIFDSIGFSVIKDEIFRHLVVARLSQPMSKSATVDYLKSYFDEDIKLHKIYRYLDKLQNSQQELVQQISVEHTKKILGGKIGLAFYDVTTLYFETDESDDFRERGWSKDGKHSQPQIILGLLVSKGGYPLAYSLFNGSQYEGRTMLPVVEEFVRKFDLDDFVIVADSGLMNQKNILLLEKEGYKYIVGARIKNVTNEIKQWIFSLEKQDGLFHEITKSSPSRLIIGYSQNRAKKDKYNREQGVQRLKMAYKSGIITKENINKRGYNKFLKLTDNVKVELYQGKINEDEKWDGLKGYITNTELASKEVCEQYNELWVIEKAYRVTKGTLAMRPMFHFTPKRI